MSAITPGLSVIVDASGNPLAGTFGAPLPTTNIAGTSTGSSSGLCMGGLSSTTQRLTPLMLDATGSLIVRQALTTTMACFPTTQVGTGSTAGKSMMSFWNGSSSVVMRFLAFTATCPPQVNTSGTLLGLTGSTTSYTQVMMGVYRITGHSGGTLGTLISHDPADDSMVDPLVTARVGATVTGEMGAPICVWDAAYNSRLAIGGRPDQNLKVWTMPPGSGLHIKCLTTLGGTNSVNFYLGAIMAQNIA